MSSWLGIDIGGANLKIADGTSFAHSVAFPLWRQPEQLVNALRRLIAEAPACERLALTMTAELADCFACKSDGVETILDAFEEAADGRHSRVYLSDGRLVTPIVARREPQRVAAANWHALARFCSRFVVKGTGLLIDMGSTTTDIIPIAAAGPADCGQTDTQRLIRGELLYTGVARTPVCAVASSTPYRNTSCGLAQELFAIMQDVYLILGDLLEDAANLSTADGRPATKACARARMGRMICADEEEFHHRDAAIMAQAIAESQTHQVYNAISQLVQERKLKPRRVVISGQGEFLLERVVGRVGWESTVISLRQQLGGAISTSATAHALAVLASEVST